MTAQASLNFNFFPENPFNRGTQSYFLYEHLAIHREVTTKELHNYLRVDTARLRSDIRPYLRKNGLDHECKSIPGEQGNRVYRIRF